MSDRRTVHRVCPFCEATCGLTIEVEDNAIVSVRGDQEDPFSRGYICPKALGSKQLYDDPDRLRQPVGDPAASARVRCGSVRRLLRPHGHVRAGVWHPGELGR